MQVSVLITAYNHERFIGKAVRSVLMQQTDFEYDLVIIEDCSTDHTRELLIGFQRSYPNRIRLVLNERNECNNQAWAREIVNAAAPYIALLDGDDYWTSPHKLQKQVDFLDSHLECSTCFHNTLISYDDGDHEPYESNGPDQKRFSGLDDLWRCCFMQTCSVMFRTGLFESLPEWFDDMYAADWALHIFNAQHGGIGYLDEVMGVYRQHAGGVCSSLSAAEQLDRIIEFYEFMNKNLDFRYNEMIEPHLHRRYRELANLYEESEDREKANACRQTHVASWLQSLTAQCRGKSSTNTSILPLLK